MLGGVLDEYVSYADSRLRHLRSEFVGGRIVDDRKLAHELVGEYESAVELIRLLREELRAKREGDEVTGRAEIVSVVDSDCNLEYICATAFEVLGYGPFDLYGKRADEFVHPDDLKPLRDALRLMESIPGETVRLEFRVRHAEGSWCSLRSAVRHIKRGNGQSWVFARSQVFDIELQRDIEAGRGFFFKRAKFEG